MGPTPPGTGVNTEATGSAGRVGIAHDGAADSEVPASMSTTPGFQHLGSMRPGLPAPETMISASLSTSRSGSSFVIVRPNAPSLLRAMRATGSPTSRPCPTTTAFFPSDRYLRRVRALLSRRSGDRRQEPVLGHGGTRIGHVRKVRPRPSSSGMASSMRSRSICAGTAAAR
jgi:hypothetical protein